MQLVHLSHSCAQMITFYSDNPVLNPAEVYSFHCIPKLFRIEPKNEKVAHTLKTLAFFPFKMAKYCLFHSNKLHRSQCPKIASSCVHRALRE